MMSRRFLISGTVQGVGCRAQIAQRVRERWPELRGFVKNLADGRVEVQATGDAETLERVEEFEGSVPELLGAFAIRR